MTTQKTLQRQAERKEARISQMLSLLAERPLYRDELCRAMSISTGTTQEIIRYAKEQGWIISHGKYYINPYTVFVADGKIVRDYKMDAVMWLLRTQRDSTPPRISA